MPGREWTLELRAPTPIRSNNALLSMPWQQAHRERSDWRHLAYTLARHEVGWGLIPDDTSVYLDGPHIAFGERIDRRRFPYGLVVITITDLSTGADPAHHNGTGRDIGEWAGLDLADGGERP